MMLVNPVTGRPVYFDDCRLTTGTMIEAKGSGYAKMLRKPEAYPGRGVLVGFSEQAERQEQAAGARLIEWHFAEKDAADYVRVWLGVKYPRIVVIHTPAP